jgi:hypothetical protein
VLRKHHFLGLSLIAEKKIPLLEFIILLHYVKLGGKIIYVVLYSSSATGMMVCFGGRTAD